MSGSTKKIMTVRGEITLQQAGITLVHEHVGFDARCLCHGGGQAGGADISTERVSMERLGDLRRNPLCIKDNLIVNDIELLVDSVRKYKVLGGRTIVDVTPPDIGRDPIALKTISERTGVNIVAGSTHYIQVAHPASVENESVDEVAERVLNEVLKGIGDTGVRPGILGEVGTSNPIHPAEKKVLRAAARVSAKTGMAITLHMDPTAYDAFEVLDVLESEGADLRRVVVGHLDASINRDELMDGSPIGYILKVMARGPYIALDCFGEENWYGGGIVEGSKAFMCPSDQQRVHAVLKILEKGKLDQLLISQDACMKMSHVKYGGFGYGYILKIIVPQLRAYGVSAAEIDRIMVENPKNMLAY